MALYRGYEITYEKSDRGIRIEIHPTMPDLPILRRYWFLLQPLLENQASDEAKRRVDEPSIARTVGRRHSSAAQRAR
jgi:hypothetical protein